jgi:ABC-2 type transport system permease protein
MSTSPSSAGQVSERTAAAAVPGAWQVGLSRVGIELKQFFRDREAAVFTFTLPLIMLFIFGSVFSEDITEGVTFSQYFVTGMIASGVMYTAFQNLAIVIPLERDDGTLKRLQGTPMPKAAYFIGKVGLVVVSFVAQVSLLMLIGALFFGLELPSEAQDWATFAWVSVLGLVSCTLLGIAYSSVPKTGRGAAAIVTPVVLVLQFTSGVFFLYHELPGWMQQFSALFPLKWLCQGMRSVFLPDSFSSLEPRGEWELDRVAIVLVCWCIAAFALALWSFRWQRRGDT